MFFQETKNLQLADIDVPAIFFEQILPVIDGKFAKIYLYAYYLLVSSKENEMMDNQSFANKLKLSLEEVLEAWDFLESCGVIKKHSSDNSLAWDFSIEFIDLKNLYLNKSNLKTTVSTDELILLSKNENLKGMFDKIEGILKRILSYNELRTINEFMKEYNVSTDLVIEAFSFSASIKKVKTVAGSLSVLRTWYLDGVRTKEDLEQHLENRHKRYFTYRKILSLLGEYRLPTKAEEKLMDTWVDNMNFSMEVIEKAFEKSLAIKNPNLNYVNGILKNWHEKLVKRGSSPHVKPEITALEHRTKLMEAIKLENRIITDSEDKMLHYLYTAFPLDICLSAVEHLKSVNALLSIESLFTFLNSPSQTANESSSETIKLAEKADGITLSEIQDIIDEKPARQVSKTRPTKTSTLVNSKLDNEELEAKLMKKRQK